MAKNDSVFTGAMNSAPIKSSKNTPTQSVLSGGEPGYQKRTKSPRGQLEVLYVKPSGTPAKSRKG